MMRTKVQWTSEKRDLLINLVREEKDIWCKSTKNYRRMDLVKDKWRKLGQELETTGISERLQFLTALRHSFNFIFVGDEAEKEWKRLKKSFYYSRSSSKLPSGSAGRGKYKTENSKFMEKLSFLQENMRTRMYVILKTATLVKIHVKM